MSLPVFNPQTHLFGLQARSSDVFSERDRYRLFAEKVYPLLVEARPKLEACYGVSNGRPGVEPVLLLGVSVLQFLERVPDLKQQAEMGLEKPSELYVDGAYVSGQSLAEAEAEGRQLVGPAQPPAQTGKSAFKSDAFDIDVEQRRALCPGGPLSTQCSRLEEEKTGQVNYRFEWSTHCHDCPLRGQCVPGGQQHRTLVVGQYHTPLQARRQAMKTAEFQQQMKQRNAIEGTHSELVRAHGLRRARYRGLKKVALQNYLIGAACNVKRWIRRMQWELKQAMPLDQCVPQVS